MLVDLDKKSFEFIELASLISVRSVFFIKLPWIGDSEVTFWFSSRPPPIQ